MIFIFAYLYSIFYFLIMKLGRKVHTHRIPLIRLQAFLPTEQIPRCPPSGRLDQAAPGTPGCDFLQS